MHKLSLKILFIFLVLITAIATLSSASYSTVTMSVVEEPVCTINFGSGSSFEKRLYSKDLSNKEVTIQLKVKNNETASKPTGELMLVIDNSKSMIENNVGNKTREEVIIDSAKNLITNLLENNTALKIGAVSFSTNTDVSKEGTLEDAALVSNLTNNSTELLSAIDNIQYNGPRTDLDSGLKLAKQYFTDSTDKSHKYIIVLSDGVPNVAINYDKNYYSDDVISKTKAELQSLSTVADNIIVLLTGITEGSQTAYPSSKTYDQIVQEIFGTQSNPTIGKFYYVTDEQVENTIKNRILNDLRPVSSSLTNINIVDYFPKEIVDNFDFSKVNGPNIGSISTEIDKTNNSITWTIPELKPGETAIYQYKLKLKEDFDSSIVGKILDTNEKIDLSYTNTSGETEEKTSDVTPKLKLTEPETPNNPKTQNNSQTPNTTTNEVLPTVYPKTGVTVMISLGLIALIVVAVSGYRYYKINKDLK